MKSVLCVLIIFTVFVVVSFASMQIGKFSDPQHPGKCSIKSNLILSPGEEVENPDTCGRIICINDGYADIHMCGAQGFADGCRLGDIINPNLSYPDCCERKTICD